MSDRCNVCGEKTSGKCDDMPLCYECYDTRADEVHKALADFHCVDGVKLEYKETKCICQGFYQPRHCPVHGR